MTFTFAPGLPNTTPSAVRAGAAEPVLGEGAGPEDGLQALKKATTARREGRRRAVGRMKVSEQLVI
jgi:hypothetical protein